MLKIMFISGMGFFTDAYDLFVIGIVVALLKTEWHLSTGEVSWLNSATLLASGNTLLQLAIFAHLPGRGPDHQRTSRVAAELARLVILLRLGIQTGYPAGCGDGSSWVIGLSALTAVKHLAGTMSADGFSAARSTPPSNGPWPEGREGTG